ncbi:MAG: hypothetical protein ISR53_03565, partial [Rhodospirillales bacterium]|nr:hypothetical protein [Rhodospirillales bacterium]
VTTESGPVKTVARTIADNEAAIDASRTELDQKVTDAATSATASQTARTASEVAEAASELAQLGAEAAEAMALTSETNADTAKAASEIARDAASTSAGQAATSQSASAVSENNSAASALAAATSETNTATRADIATTKASEASVSADAAAFSASAANTSAAEASGAAASLNLPTASGQAGQYLRQKQDETGLEYAEVDLASRVAKSGDTMTGDLTLPNLVATGTLQSGADGDNARSTGFKIADGTDIGELNRVSQYYDDRIDNCAGYIPGGNCSGDLRWTPPNGDWWTWGLGFSPANPNGYDFAGGQTIGYQTVPVDFVYAPYSLAADEIGGGEYRRDVNNCNCGTFNCYSNCNCNCACACACACNCADR